ncbi:hypothetical protein ABZ479_32280 [Streptomyces sp. NPDC005722]
MSRDVRNLRDSEGSDLGTRGGEREEFDKLRNSVQGLGQTLVGI